MTLILTVNTPETIWLLADRRLSSGSRILSDDARKVMFLETTDGTAILGYAGLGSTALRTEPADWMSAVLRGRNLPLEQSLAVLAEALKQQFPRHMLQITRAHHVFVSAFLGNEPRLYTIELAFAPDRRRYAFLYTRLIFEKRGGAITRTPRIGITGTGAQHLARDMKWKRMLLRMVRAHDRGQVQAHTVADHLASLNHEVHCHTSDKSVGPRCIVAWRHRKGGVHKSGGASQLYINKSRDYSSADFPIIGCGMDMSALLRISRPRMMMMAEAMRRGEPVPEWNSDEINAELARLPDKPDEHLR